MVSRLLAAALLAISGCNPVGSPQSVPVASPSGNPTAVPVAVRVRLIEGVPASPGFLDPALTDLSAFLRQHMQFGFIQRADTTHALTPGTLAKFSTPAADVEVELVDATPEGARMRVALRRATSTILDRTFRTGPHKYFFIAGPRTPRGGVLFVAIEAH